MARTEAAKVREDLKTKAANTRGTPDQLISDSLLSTTVDVRAALGDMDALKLYSPSPEGQASPQEPISHH